MIHILKTPTIFVLITLFISSCNQEKTELTAKNSSPAETKSAVADIKDEVTYEVVIETTETISPPVITNEVILMESKPAGKAMKDLVDNLSEEDLANIPIIKLDANNEPKPATKPMKQTKKANKAQ